MRPPGLNSPSKWVSVSNPAAAARSVPWAPRGFIPFPSALQHPDDSVGKTQAFRHYRQHVSEQSLAQRRVFAPDGFESLRVKLVKDARGFGLNGGAAWLLA